MIKQAHMYVERYLKMRDISVSVPNTVSHIYSIPFHLPYEKLRNSSPFHKTNLTLRNSESTELTCFRSEMLHARQNITINDNTTFKSALPANSNPNLVSIVLLWAFVGRQKPEIHVRPNS